MLKRNTLEAGIITDCPMSVNFFALAMNMIKSAEKECRGLVTRKRVKQPSIAAYMDDITISALSVTGKRLLLKGLEEFILWVRMSFNSAKSKSLVLKQSRGAEKIHFTVSEETLPALTEKSVKSPGKSWIPR